MLWFHSHITSPLQTNADEQRDGRWKRGWRPRVEQFDGWSAVKRIKYISTHLIRFKQNPYPRFTAINNQLLHPAEPNCAMQNLTSLLHFKLPGLSLSATFPFQFTNGEQSSTRMLRVKYQQYIWLLPWRLGRFRRFIVLFEIENGRRRQGKGGGGEGEGYSVMHLIRAAKLGHVHLLLDYCSFSSLCYQSIRILSDNLESLFFLIAITKRKVAQCNAV